MANNQQQYGTPFRATQAGTSTTTATVTGVTGTTFYVTDVCGSSDLANTSTIQIKDGSTVIWQGIVGNASSYTMSFSTPLRVTQGATLTVVVTGTANSTANVSGYSIP